MTEIDTPRHRIFATADIGDAAFARLRERGYEVEVYPHPEPPPKSVILEKVHGGIDGLITTLRDMIDVEVFGEGYLRFSVANSVENLQDALDRIDQWTKKNL